MTPEREPLNFYVFAERASYPFRAFRATLLQTQDIEDILSSHENLVGKIRFYKFII